MTLITRPTQLASLPCALMLMSALAWQPAQAGKVLDGIRQRGQLVCGVSNGVAGFSAPDAKGRWQGLDVDVCRAVAAAVLGSGEKVRFTPLNATQRFASLQSGQVDILSRNTSWTLTRDASLGLHFTAITYFDGQAFLVPTKLKLSSAKQLKGAQVCVQAGTTSEKNLSDYSRTHSSWASSPWCSTPTRHRFKALFAGPLSGFLGRCLGAGSSIRNKEAPNPDDYTDPARADLERAARPGRASRGDDEWFAIVKWTVYALAGSRGTRV